MSSVVDEFEQAFQSCVAAISAPTSNYTHDLEEVKTSADQTVQRFLDSAKQMECFFLQKRLFLSVHRPEQMMKEDIDEIKAEIVRKDAVISRFQDKLQQWQGMLSDQPQAVMGMTGGPAAHPLAPPAPHPMIQQHLQQGHQSPGVPQMGMRGPHPGQQMMGQMTGVPHSAPPHLMSPAHQQAQHSPAPQMHMQQQQPHGHMGPQHVMQPGMRMQGQGPTPPHLMNPGARGPMMQPNYGPSPAQHHFMPNQMGMQQQVMPQQQQQPMPQVMQQQPPQQQQQHQAQQSPLAFLERTTSNIGMPDARR